VKSCISGSLSYCSSRERHGASGSLRATG